MEKRVARIPLRFTQATGFKAATGHRESPIIIITSHVSEHSVERPVGASTLRTIAPLLRRYSFLANSIVSNMTFTSSS